MYYARILDHTLLPAVTYLACFQAAPTLDTMAAMERLLGYYAKHSNATQVITLPYAPYCFLGCVLPK